MLPQCVHVSVLSPCTSITYMPINNIIFTNKCSDEPEMEIQFLWTLTVIKNTSRLTVTFIRQKYWTYADRMLNGRDAAGAAVLVRLAHDGTDRHTDRSALCLLQQMPSA